MPKDRDSWRVCYAHDDIWDCISAHDTRGEAEAERRKARHIFPHAFLVRVTFRHVNRVRTTSSLKVV